MYKTLYSKGFVLELAERKPSITNPCNTSTVHSCAFEQPSAALRRYVLKNYSVLKFGIYK